MKRDGGFTVIESILLLVIAGIIGFTGWYVWSSKNKTENSYKNSAQVSSSTPRYSSITSVHLSNFSGLPTDLKQTILKNAPCASNGNLLREDGSIDNHNLGHYVDRSSAFIGQCQTVAFYVYTEGHWKYISRTQYGFDCNVLNQYKVPRALVSAALPYGQCLDLKNNFVDYQ